MRKAKVQKKPQPEPVLCLGDYLHFRALTRQIMDAIRAMAMMTGSANMKPGMVLWVSVTIVDEM